MQQQVRRAAAELMPMEKALCIISKLSEAKNSSVVSFKIPTPYELEVTAKNFEPSYLKQVIQIADFIGVCNDNGVCVLRFYFVE